MELSGQGCRFQLTPPRGGDPVARPSKSGAVRFQLTPPRGGDWERCSMKKQHYMFQLTPPRGGDKRNFDKS